MAIEDTILGWWNEFLASFFSILAIDSERILALLGLGIIALIIAKWGKGIIAKPLKAILGWKRIQNFTKIKPSDIDEKIGWAGLLYHVPNLFRVLIVIGAGAIALDLLEFDVGSGLLGQVFLFIPNVIAVVGLLWVGVWLHYVGTEIINDAKKITFLKGDRTIPLYGFYVALWGIIISISMTQLQVGTEIIPILVGGVVVAGLIVGVSVREVILNKVRIDSLKSLGVDKGVRIKIEELEGGNTMKIDEINATHIKVSDEHGNKFIVDNKLWTVKFSLPKD